MTAQKYKYNINFEIGQQPRSITIGQIEKILSKEHGISRDTFYRDRNLLLNDDFSIPSERLDIYAALFNVTADQLKNYQTKKITPLVERKPSETMKKVIKRTGLTKAKK